ncbi:hypothetical protein [Rhodopila sp.]|uniref:outer membrane lipoprotein n=1 Tax=Rhodopila sp. TaxID=2480087 RepID=UPI003D0D6196
MNLRFLVRVIALFGMSACAPTYSPDTYASNAAQQANKVEQGVVVGLRPVAVSATGTVGTLTGAAAGGIGGSQVGVGPFSALAALGGSFAGGLAGSAAEHVTADTRAYEYIVRKPNGDLVSVTQNDKTPLALGQKVLVIAGLQARVVPDYTVPPVVLPAKPGAIAKAEAAIAAKPETDEAAAKPGTMPISAVTAVSAAPAEVAPAAPRAAAIPAGAPQSATSSSSPADPAGSGASPAP